MPTSPYLSPSPEAAESCVEVHKLSLCCCTSRGETELGPPDYQSCSGAGRPDGFSHLQMVNRMRSTRVPGEGRSNIIFLALVLEAGELLGPSSERQIKTLH